VNFDFSSYSIQSSIISLNNKIEQKTIDNIEVLVIKSEKKEHQSVVVVLKSQKHYEIEGIRTNGANGYLEIIPLRKPSKTKEWIQDRFAWIFTWDKTSDQYERILP